VSKLESHLAAALPYVLSLFRVVLGLLLTVHATQKLFAWPVGTATAMGTLAGPAVPMGSWPFWWAGLIELVVGVLLIAGLVTRLAAFIGSGEMAFAYFMQHRPIAFWPIENGGELAVVMCFGFLLLVFAGGGALAVDALRTAR
jgi:putative oxidoreductase